MLTAKNRSAVFDKISLILWGTMGGVTLLVCILAFSQWSIHRTGEKRHEADLVELNSLFEKAISDGTVQGIEKRDFLIRRLRGRSYIISFTNSVGEICEVLVAPALEKNNLWRFHQETPGSDKQVFYLNMVDAK